MSRIPESDRIPSRQKFAFSLGGQMDYLAIGLTMGTLWMPYFNIGMGLSPSLIGLVLMILRAWDAISDPLIGNFSDNARTRWGRRRPFMFIGAIVTAAIYPFLWRLPQGGDPQSAFIYLLVIGVLYFTAFTFWSMPYYGMQLELTPNYDERTRLTAWMAFCGKIMALGGGWVMAILTGSLFADPVTGEADLVTGLRTFSWVIAAIMVILGLLPALFVKERYYKAETSKQSKDPFWHSIRESIRCYPMWCLAGVAFFVVMANASVATLGQYVNIYLINGGNVSSAAIIDGWKYTAMLLVGILTIPFWTWLSEILDKKLTLVILIVGGMVGQFLYYFCLKPDMPYLQLIPAVMQSGTIAAVWLFLPSMKADVADYDEMKTSRRREGALNAFFSWFVKAAMTFAMGAGGFLLDFSGFDVSLGVQPDLVLNKMVWIYLIVPVSFFVMSLVLLILYPLDRKKMAEIRLLLETRRGKL